MSTKTTKSSEKTITKKKIKPMEENNKSEKTTIGGDEVAAYKCTRPDGTDFRTGTVNYAEALAKGETIEVLDVDRSDSVCQRGVHVSPTAKKTCQFGNNSFRPWRWFEGAIEKQDIIAQNEDKIRVTKFTPKKEIFLEDIFGKDLAERVASTKQEIDTWKSIPWLKPSEEISDKEITSLVNNWRKALSPWLKPGQKLAGKVKVVRAANAAVDAAYAAANAVNAAADAANAADAAAYAADAADAAKIIRLSRYYVKPDYVLRRYIYWQIAGMTGDNPWTPLVQLYKLGCFLIGFANDEFVVYCPQI